MSDPQQPKVETATEAELGGDNCDKNPGHEGFIPFSEFSINHLPVAWREERVFQYIKNFGQRVVRLIVTKENGEKHFGSGLVEKWGDTYVIATNHHVIENEREAKRCLIEFDYNQEDRSGVVECEGTGLLETSQELDKTLITFLPVPKKIKDLNILDETLFIPEICCKDENGQVLKYPALVMPHKTNNTATFLAPSACDLNKMKNVEIHFRDGTVGKPASERLRFEPILDKLKASVQIPDENNQYMKLDGNLKIDAKDVYLKLPVPITEEEARRCTVQFPDGSVAKGTGIHFVPTNLINANIQGLDLNLDNLLATGNPLIQTLANYPFWNVPFKPFPVGLGEQLDIQESNDTEEKRQLNVVVVIGHPHGGVKMVTIGRHLPTGTLQPTDRGPRFSIGYSCKTCPGSSGSPVLYLRSWRWYIHSLGSRIEECRGEIVETGNLNQAFWWKKYINDIFIPQQL